MKYVMFFASIKLISLAKINHGREIPRKWHDTVSMVYVKSWTKFPQVKYSRISPNCKIMFFFESLQLTKQLVI